MDDDLERLRTFQQTDDTPAFDPDALSMRVIKSRAKRRRRRTMAVGGVVAALLVGVGLYATRKPPALPPTPKHVAVEAIQSDDVQLLSASDERAIAILATIGDQQRRIDDLLKRLDRTPSVDEAINVESNRMLLDRLRAEHSVDVPLPELSDLIAAASGDVSTN